MNKISIVVDNPNSWMNNYAKEFVKTLKQKGHDATFCNNQEEIKEGEIAVFLSCEKIVSKKIMSKNKHNLVVHESDLPKGKGWSPASYQVLEGKNNIPITLFEAVEKVDAGPIYFKEQIELQGHELIDELREKQAKKTFELIIKFLEKYPNVSGKAQSGEETFYKKRIPADSRIDINKSIAEQFNLLRIVDNQRYPAFFEVKGKKYIVKIYKEGKI